MADNPPTLGTVLTGTHYRDAIHIAIAPVVADERLFPGQRIGFVNDMDVTRVHRKLGARAIGIVDPFLTDSVNPGDQFYMFLLPNTITSLRHEWTHPAFHTAEPSPQTAKSESERWMRAWAMKHMSEDYYGDGEKLSEEAAYANAIEAGRNHRVGPYENARDHIDNEWWSHWETITGEHADRDTYFSCAC